MLSQHSPLCRESISAYDLVAEREFCVPPDACRDAEVVLVGSGIALSMVGYLQEQATLKLGRKLRVAVLESGPMDALTHFAHTHVPRRAFIGTERIGGKLALWGVSAPRPSEVILRRWPYVYDDLVRRFERREAEMGVDQPIPKSDGTLQTHLHHVLREAFPQSRVLPAPLAINADGRRWSPLDEIPNWAQQGLLLVANCRCTHLETSEGRITALRGTWQNEQEWTLSPQTVVLGVGIEASLPLVRQTCCTALPLEVADHIRIDAHGSLPAGHFGSEPVDRLGVAVLLMECHSREHRIPYHLEVKVAPRNLWNRGYMPSGDNLRSAVADSSIWVQIQAIAAMHDRIPALDLLNVGSAVPPVMSSRDAAFHCEIVSVMQQVAGAMGLPHPMFNLRPLLTNHHAYGAFRVGKAVDADFRFREVENLFILPPTSFVDVDDDANPTLKSRVLSEYAMEAIVGDFSFVGLPH